MMTRVFRSGLHLERRDVKARQDPIGFQQEVNEVMPRSFALRVMSFRPTEHFMKSPATLPQL